MTPILFALLIVLAEAAFAAGGATGKSSLGRLDLFSFAFLRALGGVAGILLVSTLTGKADEMLGLDSSHLPLVALSAALFATGNALYVAALKVGDLSVVTPLVRSSPLFVLVLALLFLRERITLPFLLSTPLILSGVVLISGARPRIRETQQPSNNRGVFLALGISILDAGWLVASKATLRGVSPYALALIQLSAYLLISFALALLLKRLKAISVRQAALACASGFLSWGIGDVIYLIALREVPAILAALLSGTGILFSVVFGGLFFRERLAGRHLVGACLIVLGATLATIRGG